MSFTEAQIDRRRRYRQRRRERQRNRHNSDSDIDSYIQRAERHVIISDIEPESPPIFRPRHNFNLIRRSKSPTLELLYQASKEIFNLVYKGLYNITKFSIYITGEIKTKLSKSPAPLMIEERPPILSSPPTSLKTSNVLCSVCIHNSINMIAIKCGHASLCEECALQIINTSDSDDSFIQVRCPICRESTTFTKIIYSGYDDTL